MERPRYRRRPASSLSPRAAIPAALLILAQINSASAAPQTFNTALPVAKGRFVLREQLMNIEATDDPTPAAREISIRGAISVLGFGVTPRIAVFGVLPYLDKALELGPAERVTRGTAGIGDMRLFGRYTAFQKDGPGRTFRVAPFFGVEVPTGDDDDRDGLGVPPRPLQAGSGAVDAFAGVVLTRQSLAYQVDAQLSYEGYTEAGGFELGGVLRLDASLQYRLWPRVLGEGVPGFVYGVIEANLAERDENVVGGARDRDSGGTTLHLSPGVQYVTRRFIVEGIVQVPVIQNLGGNAVEEDRTVRVGFRVNF